MTKKCARAKSLRDGKRAQHGVFQQSAANAFSAPRFVHREASQEDHRNRVWHVATRGGRRIRSYDRPGTQAVIRYDFPARSHNVCLRCPLRIVLARALLQPAFETALGALEATELVFE